MGRFLRNDQKEIQRMEMTVDVLVFVGKGCTIALLLIPILL